MALVPTPRALPNPAWEYPSHVQIAPECPAIDNLPFPYDPVVIRLQVNSAENDEGGAALRRRSGGKEKTLRCLDEFR